MDITPDLRREPPTDLAEVGEDAALVDRIRAEILRDGPIPFARFMELALYDPDGGYYRSTTARPGRGGDFLTAPELHPIFGLTLSRLVAEVWERLGRPRPFTIREYGAGTGTLALALLEGFRTAHPDLAEVVAYGPIEVEPDRIAALASQLAQAGWKDVLVEARESATPIDGLVLANEVLDALPAHRVRQRGAALRELAVELTPDGRLIEVEVEPSTPALAGRLADEGITLVDGQTAEICLALDDWVATASAGLRRGLLLLIDYGAPAPDLYDPVRRRDGTLRAYLRHQVHDDPYRHVGRQDLTAHVDVTAVERAAGRAGLETVGITTQAEALVGLGIEERLRAIQADPATTLDEYLVVRSALMRMLDPAAMGRFRVMGFGRGWPAGPLSAAFAYRLPERPGPPRIEPD
jgi:SAM-dependent MidA family methyltransferase